MAPRRSSDKPQKKPDTKPARHPVAPRPASATQARSRRKQQLPAKPSVRAASSPAVRQPWTPWGKWALARRERKSAARQAREDKRSARHRARQLRWSRRRRQTARGLVFLFLMVLACGIAAAVFLLLGHPYPWEALADMNRVQRLETALADNQRRWNSLAVQDYMVEIEYADNAQTWCGPVRVEVRQGQLVAPPTPAETHWFPPDSCESVFENLAVDAAFDWLAVQLENLQPGQSTLEVSFDPEFGYPSEAVLRVYRHETPGCCWHVTWRSLEPVYDE